MIDVSWPPRRVSSLWAAGSFVVLLALVALGDRGLARAATHLSAGSRHAWTLVSDAGLSGYMFAIAALVAALALALRARAKNPRARLKWRLVAERACFFFVAIGLPGILVQLIKHAVGRARPKLLAAVGAFHFEPFSLANTLASFPSGHTTTAFSAAVALGFVVPRARVPLLMAALLIGISRVASSDHYPSDVLAGAALGSVVAFWVAQVFAERGIAFDPTRTKPRIRPLPPMRAAPDIRS